MTTGPIAIAEATGASLFQASVEAGGFHLLMDEPVADGGLATGPGPFDLLRASLASCTLMTLRSYAQLKGWTVDGLRVSVTHTKGDAGTRDRFDRVIEFGDATGEQRDRLLKIAMRCPVHLLLERGADTTLSVAA